METDYAALQQKLDAMAVDIALNGWVACSPEWIGKNGPCSCEAAPRIAFGNIGPHYHPQSFTPVSDAYLNSVRAEGVDSFQDWLRNSADIFDKNSRHQWADKNRVAADKAKEFAEQLRSGTHDTADKGAK